DQLGDQPGRMELRCSANDGAGRRPGGRCKRALSQPVLPDTLAPVNMHSAATSGSSVRRAAVALIKIRYVKRRLGRLRERSQAPAPRPNGDLNGVDSIAGGHHAAL